MRVNVELLSVVQFYYGITNQLSVEGLSIQLTLAKAIHADKSHKKCQALALSPFNLHDAPYLLMPSRRQVTALSCHDVPVGLLTTPYGVTTIRRLGFPKDSPAVSS